MSQTYDRFQYLFPSRPKTAITSWDSESIKLWRTYSDAIAQIKLNGTRMMIYVTPEGGLDFWKRDKERPRNWNPSDKLLDEIKKLTLPKGYWHVLDGESLHLKNANYKDTFYLFDIMVYKSEYLIGESYAKRYDLLRKIAKDCSYFDFAEESKDKIYLAQNYSVTEWDSIWQTVLQSEICEGLVFKRTGAISRLETGWADNNNTSWQQKLRVGNKMFLGA